MLVNFNELYREAIALSTAKQKYTKKDSSLYDNAPQAIRDVFGDRNRLIYPIKIDTNDISESDHDLYEDIKNLLLNHGYNIWNFDSYIKGIAYPVRGDDIDIKNPTKIGKLLTKYAPTGEIEITDRETRSKKQISGQPLLHAFKIDPVRQTTQGKYFVVISRHPYDVAGMSTDRNWTSCMDMGPRIEYKSKDVNQGLHASYIDEDVAHGSMVAYLVSDEDRTPAGKIALRRPLSRILMKPYITPADNTVAYGTGRMYGVQSKNFQNFVETWLLNLNRDIDTSQLYTLHPELYHDEGDRPVGFKSNLDVAEDVIKMYTDPQQTGYVWIDKYNVGQRGTVVPIGFFFEYNSSEKLPDLTQSLHSIRSTTRDRNFDTLPTIVQMLLDIFARHLDSINRNPIVRIKTQHIRENNISVELQITTPITMTNLHEAGDYDIMMTKLHFLSYLNWSDINNEFQSLVKYANS